MPSGRSSRNSSKRSLTKQYTPSNNDFQEVVDEEFDPLAATKVGSNKRPARNAREAHDGRDFREIMELRDLEREESRVEKLLEEKKLDETVSGSMQPPPLGAGSKRSRETDQTEGGALRPTRKRRSRWDADRKVSQDEDPAASSEDTTASTSTEIVQTSRFTDDMLDAILPSEGYRIVNPPANYKTSQTQIVPRSQDGFSIMHDNSALAQNILAGSSGLMSEDIPGVGSLQFLKDEDLKYFGKLRQFRNPSMSASEKIELEVMQLLLEVKNGTAGVRKVAMRKITDNARKYGAEQLFGQLLPLLIEPSLSEQERHLLVKVVDRVLYKLGELVGPFTHRILVVIEPLLVEEDGMMRAEGREIIKNLSKAAGLAQMISVMRPDIDHDDEYVRDTTSRTMAIVASALGIPPLLPFLKAVVLSKKAWTARHTGMKIIRQMALLMHRAVLPHLNGLVECASYGIEDSMVQVKTASANALTALADASHPYGIEAFEQVLKPLWKSIRRERGRILANVLRAVGAIIQLMNPDYASYYTKEVITILRREFDTGDEEMRRTVLQVLSQCVAIKEIPAQYLLDNVLDSFFQSFWVRRIALDRRANLLVVQATSAIAERVGFVQILPRLIGPLKDESEVFRIMAMESIKRLVIAHGVVEITGRDEELLLDASLTAFQSQSKVDATIFEGLAQVIVAFGGRCKPYMTQILSSVLFRLGSQEPTFREQAADLIARIAVTVKVCGDEEVLLKLGNVLYEQLGEEYPDVLGSILNALRSVVAVVGPSTMQPPIRDLLPRLTPILRNRHEKVQQNCISLVGVIADRGAEYVPAKEWMRICFELLDMLKAQRKATRFAANETFGYIAKAIGPQDVLATLLTNLRVQERQSRVCAAVAIGIVAETCQPFTVLPALMNEYRTPDSTVQNGVLKAMTFMFEYIGSMASDYLWAITPLIEEGLTDPDFVHRQTACTVVKHIAYGCTGLNHEDIMIHFLNLVIPNMLDDRPQVIVRVIEAVDALRNAVGTGLALAYIWAGLFHPVTKVRNSYWTVYNNCYVQSVDTMTPYYPDAVVSIPEMDVWL